MQLADTLAIGAALFIAVLVTYWCLQWNARITAREGEE